MKQLETDSQSIERVDDMGCVYGPPPAFDDGEVEPVVSRKVMIKVWIILILLALMAITMGILLI